MSNGRGAQPQPVSLWSESKLISSGQAHLGDRCAQEVHLRFRRPPPCTQAARSGRVTFPGDVDKNNSDFLDLTNQLCTRDSCGRYKPPSRAPEGHQLQQQELRSFPSPRASAVQWVVQWGCAVSQVLPRAFSLTWPRYPTRPRIVLLVPTPLSGPCSFADACRPTNAFTAHRSLSSPVLPTTTPSPAAIPLRSTTPLHHATLSPHRQRRTTDAQPHQQRRIAPAQPTAQSTTYFQSGLDGGGGG